MDAARFLAWASAPRHRVVIVGPHLPRRGLLADAEDLERCDDADLAGWHTLSVAHPRESCLVSVTSSNDHPAGVKTSFRRAA